FGRAFGAAEFAAALGDHADVNRGPVEFFGVGLRPNRNFLAVDRDEIRARLDLGAQIAQNGVIFEQVGEHGGRGDVVDGDNLEVLVPERGPKNIPSNAAKAVDSHPQWHACASPKIVSAERRRHAARGRRGSRADRMGAWQPLRSNLTWRRCGDDSAAKWTSIVGGRRGAGSRSSWARCWCRTPPGRTSSAPSPRSGGRASFPSPAFGAWMRRSWVR